MMFAQICEEYHQGYDLYDGLGYMGVFTPIPGFIIVLAIILSLISGSLQITFFCA